MLLVSDVHGAAAGLRAVARRGEPLLVLGDLINFIDYRTYAGIVTDVTGREFVERIVALRTEGRFDEARLGWRNFARGREEELQATIRSRMEQAYAEICAALEGAEAYVTYGNVDRPRMLRRHLPSGVRFVDGEVVEIEGIRVGFAGGGMPALGMPGEVEEPEMTRKLAALGHVDVLCTHVPPALPSLSRDVIGGRQKGSDAVRDYLARSSPAVHYFGDIHQPQASRWQFGHTTCINVGYFRATGRAVRHG